MSFIITLYTETGRFRERERARWRGNIEDSKYFDIRNEKKKFGLGKPNQASWLCWVSEEQPSNSEFDWLVEKEKPY